MKSITVKLLLSIGLITMLCGGLLLYTSYFIAHKHIDGIVKQQAAMALQFDLAIRDYVGTHIRPVLVGLMGKDAFQPETMSTSFIARSIFENVRKTFPDYIIKFSSESPRNPINQAGKEEMEIIEIFDDNPELKRWQGHITINGRGYMAIFNARRMEASCLYCHGDPEDAPDSLIDRYGSVAGFHRPLGKVIGMDMVAIPITKVSGKLWSDFKPIFFSIAVGLVLFFGTVILVMKHLVINRLILISRHFSDAKETSDFAQLKPIDVKGMDEISDLALGFNRLTKKLKAFYSSLNIKVKDRTLSLELANRKLVEEIRKKKATEKALMESEQRFRALHNASFGGVAIHDAGVILDCNQGLADMTGFSIRELTGMDGLMLIAPEWRDLVRDKITKHIEGSYELEGLRKNTEKYPLRIQSKNIPYHGRLVRVSEFRDITEYKMAEKEKINAQKIVGEQQKLALIGQVAGKMAHDFNNILGIIMGNAELSLMGCTDDNVKKTFKLIYDQTIRGKNLTRDLVAFAKNQEPMQELFSFNDKIDMVLNLMKKDLDGICLIKDYGFNMPSLLADPGMIEHMLVNLFQNAIHATSKVEVPTIIVRTFFVEESICFQIEDNGCGIPKEHLDTIYEPSFTLKGSRDVNGCYASEIKGTGYGMSNVKKYIEKHMGRIFVSSTLGKGTCFTIQLPVTQDRLTSKEKKQLSHVQWERGKHVLLVEDEPDLSRILEHLLSSPPCLHRVDVAMDGQTALQLIADNDYDFVSLDYMLPGKISGMDIYRHIREKNDALPILFVSGNIEFLESITELTRDDPYLAHQSKPCKNEIYIQSVNELLVKNTHFRSSSEKTN